MPRLLTLSLAVLCTSATAHATNARITSLSSNAGFIDDTDFFRYPSTLSDLPARAQLNYDSGVFDGGFTLDDGQALWFQRHNPTGAEEGFRALYGKSSGDTGYLIRATHTPGDFSIGGAWSNGPGRGTLKNFAVDGDLHLLNKLTGDGSDPKVALQLGVTSRTLTARSLTLWGGSVDLDTVDETLSVSGAYTFGPRFAVSDARLALQVGPALDLTTSTGDGDQPAGLALTLPVANFAGEYLLRDWFRLRGSVVAAWIGTTDSEELIDNLAWTNAVTGTMGVGFSHNEAQFDMSINPTWALNGPYLLSGTENPMFAVLSARVNL